MQTVLDLEWEYNDRGEISDGSPYYGKNCLVSCGIGPADADSDKLDQYFFINHRDGVADKLANIQAIQDILDKTTLLIAHHAKADLTWLEATGFKYTGQIWCTLLGEYVLARGTKPTLDLDTVAIRYGFEGKKSALVEPYLDKGITYYSIPQRIVEEYGRADVDRCRKVYQAQVKEYRESPQLLKTLELSCEFIRPIIEMERNGMQIDRDALAEVEQFYKKRKNELQRSINTAIHKTMGATPININSSEQLSQFIYSRKVLDKNRWKEIFNIGTELRGSVRKNKRRTKMSYGEFTQYVVKFTRPVYRTTSEHCFNCEGNGKVRRTTKSGKPFKNSSRCSVCEGKGYILHDTTTIAGLKCTPTDSLDTADGGFATNGDTLERLVIEAKTKGRTEAAQVLEDLIEHNAIDTYLNTYCAGIRDYMYDDGLLRSTLNQAVAATGRLTSTRPNLHNWPRANTFPIRKAVVSRFKGGKILEIDYAQLEYTTAVELSQDQNGIASVLEKKDRHAITASVIFEKAIAEVTKSERQAAKSETFKPIYGGSSGTAAQVRYYEAFLEEHYGLAGWHEHLKLCAIKTGIVRIPSGREYLFPNARRLPNGYVTFTTQIVNYPVQGFATADIVPLTVLVLWKKLKQTGLRSLLIWTVHDSIILDVHPDETDQVLALVRDVFDNIRRDIKEWWNYEFSLPLRYEMKFGDNWRDLQDIH